MAAFEEEWTFVPPKKGKKGAKAQSSSASGATGKLGAKVKAAKEAHDALNLADVDQPVTSEAVAALVQRVRDAAKVLEVSPCWSYAQSELCGDKDCEDSATRSYAHLIMLGCGNFASQPPALLQLAFATLMREHCLSADGTCCAFDPVCTPLEVAACTALGMALAPDLEGKYHPETLPSGRTLDVLPHCPIHL